MFNKKDFNHINKMQSEMADGITDTTESQDVLENIMEIFKDTNFEDDEDRMRMMMRVVNECYSDDSGVASLSEDKAFHTVLALCFYYSNLVWNLISNGFSYDDYTDFLIKEILPSMREEAKSIPYWEVEDD